MEEEVEQEERRRYSRNVYNETIEFVPDTNGPDISPAVARGLSVNLSFSGICMYVFSPLAYGQKLVIMKGLSTSNPVLASVQWLVPVAENMYKAGLSFHG